MQQKDLELLDQYFNGQLDPEAAAEVQARSTTDAEFGAEFDLRGQMEGWLQREPARAAVRQTLDALSADYFEPAMRATPGKQLLANRWRRPLMAAAATLAVLAVATWFLLLKPSATYGDYAQHAPLYMTERGPGVNDPAAAAETAFNQKNYPAALQALDQVLAQNPNDLTAQLYRGITLLELQQPAAARTTLLPLATGSTALRGEGLWYLALSYLQENNKDACRNTLQRIPPGGRRYVAAQDLLGKL